MRRHRAPGRATTTAGEGVVPRCGTAQQVARHVDDGPGARADRRHEPQRPGLEHPAVPHQRRQLVVDDHLGAGPAAPRRAAAGARASRSTGTASSTPKGPTASRRSARRWAPPLGAVPRSAASDRMYVPAEQVTSMGNTPGSTASPTTKASTRTGTGGRSTSTPSRARSCRRRPPARLADTIGGTCAMSPVRAAARRTSPRPTPSMGQVPVTSPEASSVEVAVPSTTSPT